ncbi:MAG TPA: sigma-70 family RNA polymerase sigma factor [Thermoanaerobaculia bacterium]|nr:sigma-70 family RNA polymerase sigma factor [Thermoanaerobaculia bacterium]
MTGSVVLDPRLLLAKAAGGRDDARASSARNTIEEREFETLVRAHQEKVFRVALSVLGAHRRAEAEDVTQEVFLRLYRALPRFRAESLVSTWLYRVALHAAIDVRRQPRFRLPHVVHEETAAAETRPPDPLRTARLEAQLERLPDLQRSIVRLHYWMGYTVTEIAEMTGRAEGTVKSDLHRARRRLARGLRGASLPARLTPADGGSEEAS